MPEPAGGAQEDRDAAAANLQASPQRAWTNWPRSTPDQLVEHRYAKFRSMGNFFCSLPQARGAIRAAAR